MDGDVTFHPAYFETHFKLDQPCTDWPESFAIITAWATTGDSWTEAENRAANAALHEELCSGGAWLRCVTGFSPMTGHAEPGWAVEMEVDAACDLGQRYRQDAIYMVIGDQLYVSHCDTRQGLYEVGSFRSRLVIA